MATKLFTRIDGTQSEGEIDPRYDEMKKHFAPVAREAAERGLDFTALIDACVSEVGVDGVWSIIDALITVSLEHGNARTARKLSEFKKTL